ncbi:MAG: PorP/SprF family type IX secretion system membrane protein [Agriterribacter sp.]
MKRVIKYIVMMILLMKHYTVNAQDPFFSQAYLSPIYMNPAATGSGEYDFRVSAIHRRHWMSIPSQFNYSAVSVDKFVSSISSGFGLMGINSNEGYLRSNGFYASYAYSVCAGTESVAANGGDPKWFWTSGMQFGMLQRKIDYSKLVFADELNINGVIPGMVSEADMAMCSGKYIIDISAGTYFHYALTENSRILAGFSAHHLNRPDESLLSTGDTIRSQLPIRWTGNLMYTYTNPERTWSYSISAIGYKQNQHKNYQVGVEVTQNEYNMSLGTWYRTSGSFKDMQTIGISVALTIFGRSSDRSKIKAGIAHDAVPGNGNGYSYTGGSTEAAVVWDYRSYNVNADDPCKPRINSTSACPIRR